MAWDSGIGHAFYFGKPQPEPAKPKLAPAAGSTPTGGIVPWKYGAPVTSASDWYRQMQTTQQNNAGKNRFALNYSDKLPPHFWNAAPAMLGSAQAASILADPYAVSEAGLNKNLQANEQAYQVASQRNRADQLGSGASMGGVARGERGNVETARAANITDTVRDWEQFRQQLGDERLRSIWLPYLQAYNQAFGAVTDADAQRQPKESKSTQFLNYATAIASMFCWAAREIYGADDPRWTLARHYVLKLAPESFRRWYKQNGPALADKIRESPTLREALRPLFDVFVERAAQDLGLGRV